MRQLKRSAPWLIALGVALSVAPWPGWSPAWPAMTAVAALLSLWFRARGLRWLAPAVAWLAVFVLLPGTIRPFSEQTATVDLERFCSRTAALAEDLANNPDLNDLFSATGEALDLGFLFRLLDRAADQRPGRTIYLADDRGRLVAWGGASRAFPDNFWPLGERRWHLSWSTGEVALCFREPVMLNGRLVGAVTVVDRSDLITDTAFGLNADHGRELVFGRSSMGWQIRPPTAAGVVVPVRSRQQAAVRRIHRARWLPLLLVVAAAVVVEPIVALIAAVLGAICLWISGFGASADVAVAAMVLAVAARRWAVGLPGRQRRIVLLTMITAFVVVGLLAMRPALGSWLPARLLAPGWGGAWAWVVAWMAGGLMTGSRRRDLGRQLAVAGAVAGLSLALMLISLPLDLTRAGQAAATAEKENEDLEWPELGELLPAPVENTSLADLAPVLAERWRLADRSVPSELVVVVDDLEVSRWGDLGLAEEVRVAGSWDLEGLENARVELLEADLPWRLLADWHAKVTTGRSAPETLGFAVMTRSGKVEASLEDRVLDLDPSQAGDLYYRGTGFGLVTVGDSRLPARFERRDDRLLAIIALHPEPAEVVVRTVLAVLWAFLSLVVSCPPRIGRGELTTFGGRLRLLVAAAVVVPLALLTGLLQLQFEREERRRELDAGIDALHTARYTAIHLAGGFAVDDDLARWIAAGWWGEVALYDGADLVAASRRDLMRSSVLPELPAAEAFTSYQLGRQDTLVRRIGPHLVTAGAVDLQGRRLLLELYRPEPREDVEAPGAVDWLLAGASLAGLLALVFTGRLERRLSVSLRELVALAGRLQAGQALGQVRRPAERDLAEVLDAVRSMSEEVQRRETTLRRQEELLRITLGTLAPAVLVIDQSGQVRFANPAADRLVEDNRSLVLGYIRTLAERCRVGEGSVVDTLSPLPGTDVTWRVGVARAPLPQGEPGLVAVVDDVSELVRADRFRQLNRLARIVAHEVKNPLTPIRLWVQEIEEARRRGDEDLDDLLEQACSEISDQVARLHETANSFSNLVALERWEPTTVDLGELVKEAVAGLAVLERRGVEIALDLPSEEGCKVKGDATWLGRAVGNLVHNSVTAVGDGPGWVRVEVKEKAGWACIEVADSGGGVPDSSLENLFSPNFSTTTGGSGLGLALVSNVVSRCHGRVVANNGEHGLVVRVELPRAGPV